MDGQPVDTNTSVQTPTDINNTSVQNPIDTTQDSICDKPDIANMVDNSIIKIDNIEEIINEAKKIDDYHYNRPDHIRQKYIIHMNNNYKDKENKNNTSENNKILIDELNNEVNIFNKKFTEFFKADGRAYVNSRQILYDGSRNEFYKKGKTFGREIKDISYIIDHIAKYKAIKYLYLTPEYCKHLQTLTGEKESLDRDKRILEEYLFTTSNAVQFVGNYADNTINQGIDKLHLGVRHVQIGRGGNKRKTKKKPHRKKMRKTRSTTKSLSNIKKSKKV